MPGAVLEAGSVGLLAAGRLAAGGSASVLAAFERSFYLETAGGLIAIGADQLHDGPLNVRLRGAGSAGLVATLNVTPGQRWAISGERLASNDGLIIDLEPASIWRPAAPTGGIDRPSLEEGRQRLLTLLTTKNLPEDGLIRLCLGQPAPENPLTSRATPPLLALRSTLASALHDVDAIDHRPALDLLGLGPGLTPSGDDLLAGLLIACHRLGAGKLAHDLGDSVLAVAPERTNRISHAHLEAARQGYGAAPLHDLLEAVTGGHHIAITEALDVAAKIGHSSGFDAIGGIILALEASPP